MMVTSIQDNMQDSRKGTPPYQSVFQNSTKLGPIYRMHETQVLLNSHFSQQHCHKREMNLLLPLYPVKKGGVWQIDILL